MPVLAGDQTGVMRLGQNKHSTDEQEVPTEIAEVVSVDEKSSVIANECCEWVLFTAACSVYSQTLVAQGRDSQELSTPTKEDSASTNLHGNEDCDGEPEAQIPPKDGETASEKGRLHASSSGCGKLILLVR